MKQAKLDNYMMSIAELSAQQSKANNLKVGAVFSKEGRPLSTGWNGILEGILDDSCETNGKTRPEVIHAEMNALRYMAKAGISTNNTTLYITHSPCLNCAKHLAGIGLKRLVFKTLYKNTEGINFLQANTSMEIHQWTNQQ